MALDIPHLTMDRSPTASSSSQPPRQVALEIIRTQSQLLNQIFSSLASSSSSTSTQQQQATPLPILYQLMEQTTYDLLKLRKDVRAHQEVWARVERKKREVIQLEKRTRGIMRTLERERAELDTMVKEGKDIIASIDKLEQSTSQSVSCYI